MDTKSLLGELALTLKKSRIKLSFFVASGPFGLLGFVRA